MKLHYDYINEAVDLHQSIIFIAIPKTGTTSIRSQLKQSGNPLLPVPHLSFMQVQLLLRQHFLLAGLGENRSFPTVNVQTTAQLLEAANEFIEAAFKFSVVRNPWERAVSLYFRKEGVKSQQLQSFDQFVEAHVYASDTCVFPTRHQYQLDWLCDEHGNMAMDYVFKLEDFDRAILDIAEMTGGKLVLKPERKNVNAASKSAAYREMYTDKSRELIRKHFEKDIDTFKFVF